MATIIAASEFNNSIKIKWLTFHSNINFDFGKDYNSSVGGWERSKMGAAFFDLSHETDLSEIQVS